MHRGPATVPGPSTKGSPMKPALLGRGAAALVAAVAVSSLAAAAPARASTPPVPVTRVSDPVPGQYIVPFQPGADSDSVAHGLDVAPRFSSHAALHGFAGTLTSGQLTALQHRSEVTRIEEVGHMQVADSMTTTENENAGTWGLDRIDQRALPLSKTYNFATDGQGKGVTAYVLDTGVATTIADFGGRAQFAADAIDAPFFPVAGDCNGHGTHVAGILGGATYGVAKQVQIRSVKIGNCGGGSDSATITAAVNWVSAHAARPAVANISFGGGKSQTLDDAVNNLANSGVFVAVAAGNGSTDACTTSPAAAANAETVAATDSGDNQAGYSNYGGCVSIYAPGSSITSDWPDGTTRSQSGTS